jgi:hypothetical protein
MCCNERHGHHHGRHHGSGCEGGGCECECGGGRFEHHFQTKAEQIAELEEYLGELKVEVQAVEERLADLRK